MVLTLLYLISDDPLLGPYIVILVDGCSTLSFSRYVLLNSFIYKLASMVDVTEGIILPYHVCLVSSLPHQIGHTVMSSSFEFASVQCIG